MDPYEEKSKMKRRIAAGALAVIILAAFIVSAWLLSEGYARKAAEINASAAASVTPAPGGDNAGSADGAGGAGGSGSSQNGGNKKVPDGIVIPLLIAAAVLGAGLIVLIILRKPKTPKGTDTTDGTNGGASRQ